MIENVDLTMVNWARAQFALTAMYHWIFVPLTLGITWLCAFYETIYVKTGNEEWKQLTKFSIGRRYKKLISFSEDYQRNVRLTHRRSSKCRLSSREDRMRSDSTPR